MSFLFPPSHLENKNAKRKARKAAQYQPRKKQILENVRDRLARAQTNNKKREKSIAIKKFLCVLVKFSLIANKIAQGSVILFISS